MAVREESASREYPAAGITVTWEAGRCEHSTECIRGLPAVFQPKARPWISPEQADVDSLVDVIDRCPSYALGYRTDDGRTRTPPAE